MLGGGTWTAQDKVLPGSYINFKTAVDEASVLAERGVVAYLVSSSWGPGTNVVSVQEAMNDGLKFLGRSFYDANNVNVRELFRHARKVIFQDATTGGVKATNTYATAKWKGTLGNNIKIKIESDDDVYAVTTLFYDEEIDTQYVESAADLVSNDYVDFKTSASLTETAGTALAGGTNGTVGSTAVTSALAALESYDFNVLCCEGGSTFTTYRPQFIAYTKRMRDEYGKRFQYAHTYVSSESADNDESIICVDMHTADETRYIEWAAGAMAGCALGESLTNTLYDGELAIVETVSSQAELEQCIQNGLFVVHRVHGAIRVLKDINTLTDPSRNSFKANQVIRVLDSSNNSIKQLFDEKYMGLNPNNSAGRSALWADIVSIFEALQMQNAIEDFSSVDVTVSQGEHRTDVVAEAFITPVYALEKLYMTVYINQ